MTIIVAMMKRQNHRAGNPWHIVRLLSNACAEAKALEADVGAAANALGSNRRSVEARWDEAAPTTFEVTLGGAQGAAIHARDVCTTCSAALLERKRTHAK